MGDENGNPDLPDPTPAPDPSLPEPDPEVARSEATTPPRRRRASGIQTVPETVPPLSDEPSLQKRVDRILTEADSLPGRIAELTVAVLIIAASVLYVLERTGWVSPEDKNVLEGIETAITVVFLIEYLVRFWAKEYSIRYLFTWLALVDLIAILPLLPITGVKSLLVIRILRILRLLRIFRSRKFFFGEIAQEHLLMARILFTVFCLFFITGGILYEAEREAQAALGQPGFQTIFESFYFAVVTLTTVGFGDITPVTPIGKSVTMIAIMIGILIIPWQLANLARELLNAGKVDVMCGTCGLHGHDADASHCKACGTVIFQEYEGPEGGR